MENLFKQISEITKPEVARREIKFRGTPGPWRFELNETSKDVKLCGGVPRYDLNVMDFVRYGMGGAAPRFNDKLNSGFNIMERAEKFGVASEGRSHHSSWFKEIRHPDAQLIEAAPDLLMASIEMVEGLESVGVPYDGAALLRNLKQAIHKALNQVDV